MKNHLLVITPTLGDSKFLSKAVDSVAALSFPVTHVISCPLPKVAVLQERFPTCQVVPDAGKAGGIYGALNCAIDQATGQWDWFTYINDDDLLGSSFADTFLKHCHQSVCQDVFYGNVHLINSENLSLGRITTAPVPAFIPAMLQQGVSPLNQQGMVFSRKCVEALQGFDLKYKLCADLDFWARAYAKGFAFRFYPTEVGQFRIRPGQLSGNVMLTRQELADITQKYFPIPISKIKKTLILAIYRIYNFPRYLNRFRRVGLKTSESVLAS